VTVHQVAAGVIVSAIVFFGGAFLADNVGEALNSVWATAAMAYSIYLVWLAAANPFLERARAAGYLEPALSPRTSRSGQFISILASLAFLVLSIYFVLDSRIGIDGNPDYFQAYLGGGGAAVATVWIVRAIRVNYRKSA
jgi:hypothetical protein